MLKDLNWVIKASDSPQVNSKNKELYHDTKYNFKEF